jgi:hypothetical protein
MSAGDNDMSITREAWVEKIAKLLAKAEGAGSPQEAETFFAKAQDLMTRWGIEDAELRATGQGPAYELVKVQVILGTYSPTADATAMAAVAKAMDVVVLYASYRGSGTKPYVQLCGWSDDVDRFQMVWSTLSLAMIRLMKQAEPRTSDRGVTRKFRQSYKVGFAQGVAAKMNAAKRERMGESAGSNLPALVDRAREAEQWAKTGTRERKSTFAIDNGAFHAGRRAGLTADLNNNNKVSGKSAAALTR